MNQFSSIFKSAQNQSAKTLVFLHGFPDNIRVWKHQEEHFTSSYNLLLIPFPGTSGEDFLTEDYRLKNFCSKIREWILMIPSSQREEVIIIAHDMGGPYACHVARTLKELSIKLVLVDTFDINLFKQAIARPAQALRSTYMLLFQLPIEKLTFFKKKLALMKKRKLRPRDSYDENLCGIKSYRALAGELLFRPADQEVLTAETLVLWGKKDAYVIPLDEVTWRRYFTSVTFKVLDCDHWPMFESSEEFNQLLEEFCENYSD